MKKKIYQLKSDIETSRNKSFLRKKIKKFIENHKIISCIAFWKKRKNIFIKKWEEINIDNKKRYRIDRLQSVFCWIELIKIAQDFYKNDSKQFELNWITPNWDTIIVHIREDEINKNRYKFYVSSYIAK